MDELDFGASAPGEPISSGDVETPVDVGDPLIARAKRHWKEVSEWEGTWRDRFVEDIKFANADERNGYQWPNEIRRNREVDNKPCLTMNLTRQHNLQISNEMRKNKSQVNYVALGNGATVESALAMDQISRRIEMQSQAQDVYTHARKYQVEGGLGWWRLDKDYPNVDTFDQEIYIRAILDPLAVYMDPNIKEKSGRDAKWAFVYDEMPRETFKRKYPKYAYLSGTSSPLDGTLADGWVTKDSVRVAEYFEIETKDDTLVSFVFAGVRKTIRLSRIPSNARRALLSDPMTKTRPIKVPQVMWYLIVGNTKVDEREWPGKFIPLIRAVGEEIVVDGILDRKGHTRAMIGAQRMLNYNASAQVEFVALQGKTPWVATVQAVEGYETMWNTANTVNHSVLIYNGLLDDGETTIPPPQRTEPPQASPAYQAGMETAFQQIMMVSGQWQAQMGMGGNERTGAAIGKRQQQADTATYHFQDNYESALIFTAEQISDLVQKVYDTKRVLMILGDNDESFELTVDPQAKAAYDEQLRSDGSVARRVFNPTMGDYTVAPSVGPAVASANEETANALTLMVTQAPALLPIVGDLLVGALPFPKAQEAARRLRRMVPTQALGTGPTQQEQQLGGQVSALSKALATALQESARGQLKLVGKEQMRDIDVYKAETERMGALADALPTDPEGLSAMVEQLVHDSLKDHLSPIIEANANNIDIDGETPAQGGPAAPVMPKGAKKAPDGHHYMPDPQRPGKYLRVAPKANLAAKP